MKLSKNFSLKEMTASQTAERKGINNNPNDDQITALQKLCENILQPVRDHYATPVTVSSGFRSEDLCEAIGSSKNSQHAKGQAADFEIFGTPNAELAKWIVENLDFDQLILEYHKLRLIVVGYIIVQVFLIIETNIEHLETIKVKLSM